MAQLEARAIIGAVDETGKAFAAIRSRIGDIDKSIAGMNRTIADVGAVSNRVAPLSSTLERTARTVEQTSSAAAGLRGELEKLQTAQNKLGAFKMLQGGFAQAHTTFNETQRLVKLLAAEMALFGDEATSKLKSDFAKAQRAAAEASRTFEAQKATLVGLKDEFERLGGPLNSISSAQARIAGEVERVTAALREQGEVAERSAARVAAADRREAAAAQRRASVLDAAAQRRTQRREGVGLAGAIVGGIVAHEAEHVGEQVLDTYRDFDKERRYARAVMGITDEQQKPLVDQAIHGGATTRFNDIQFLEAQRELASRGLNINQILGMIGAGANLGMATDQDLPAAARQLESGVFGFKLDTSTPEAAIASARRVADLMVKASKISGMTPDDEVQLFKRGANPAHMAHLRPETLLAFGGVLKRANIGGDESSTAFRALVAAALAPTAGARTALLANGLNFKNYQHMRDHLDLKPFVEDIAARYGVRLNHRAQAEIGQIFGDKHIIADPAKFAPAIMHVLGDVLGGRDAKSKKSIAGEANRYRAASAADVDVSAFIADLMKKLPGNLALANALFGAKQGGRIATGLGDPETFNRLFFALRDDSNGYADTIARERMAGFDGQRARLEGSIKNVFTNIGRAWDNGGSGGPLTGATGWLADVTQWFAGLDPTTVKWTSGVGGAGAAYGGAWSAYRIGRMLMGYGAPKGPSLLARLGGALGSLFPNSLGAAGELFERFAGPLGPALMLHDIGELMNPTTPAGARYRVDTAWPTQREDFERATRAERERHQGADMEVQRGRALGGLSQAPLRVELDPNSKVNVNVTVTAGSELLRVLAEAGASGNARVGVSTAGVAPNGHGGIGSR